MKPEAVFKHFEAISQIPRGSGNEKAVSDYVKNFANNLNLKTVQDELFNLIIFKNGTTGYENKEPIILQAHLDMVCEKNAGTEHDFLKDPIQLIVEGDLIKANGTTLGADNGIGVAFCMALLEADDLQHPPLEIILTSQEETGMDGAFGLDYDLIKGRRMINLDSGDDKVFTLGCAAGASAIFYIDADSQKDKRTDVVSYTINISGLKGGHSGSDIHLERGNSIRIMGYLLHEIMQDFNIGISHISGGMKMNAIPREATATITFDKSDESKIIKVIEDYKNIEKNLYKIADPDLEITYTPCKNPINIFSIHATDALINNLILLPSGVQSMSLELSGLVNASNNIGVIETLKDEDEGEIVKITSMLRGSCEYRINEMIVQIGCIATLTDSGLEVIERSPAWVYNPNSALLETAKKCYNDLFGEEPKLQATHGGLECGIFGNKLPDIEIIAYGATCNELHTPNEYLSISSTEKVWNFLKLLLKELD